MEKKESFDKGHGHPPDPTKGRDVPENKSEEYPNQQEVDRKTTDQRRPKRVSRPAIAPNDRYRIEGQ